MQTGAQKFTMAAKVMKSALLFLICPTEQMENLLEITPCRGTRATAGGRRLWSPVTVAVAKCQPFLPLHTTNDVFVHKQTAFGVSQWIYLRVNVCQRPLLYVAVEREELTSWGLPCFAWGARLPLIGVSGAVQLCCAHVEEQSFLEVVHHSQPIAISKHHTGIKQHMGTASKT